MAARKPQTRFVVHINGNPIRLFSVREVKGGRLILTTHGGRTTVPRDGRLVEVRTFKHSIHPNERSLSLANTIHLTQEFVDGGKKELFMLSHAARNGTFQPIYVRLTRDLRSAPPLAAHARDTVISLGAHDPRTTTLIYSVWFTSAEAANRFPSNPAYSTVVHSFRQFALCIAFGFAAMPSSTRGAFVHYATTSAERITDEERNLSYSVGIAEGANSEELNFAVIQEMYHVFDVWRGPIMTELAQQGLPTQIWPPRFKPTPNS